MLVVIYLLGMPVSIMKLTLNVSLIDESNLSFLHFVASIHFYKFDSVTITSDLICFSFGSRLKRLLLYDSLSQFGNIAVFESAVRIVVLSAPRVFPMFLVIHV